MASAHMFPKAATSAMESQEASSWQGGAVSPLEQPRAAMES